MLSLEDVQEILRTPLIGVVLNASLIDPESLRPFYPEAARQRGIEGDVVLRLLIDADGSLARVDVIREPGGGLGAAGARAIRQFRFRGGKANGQPVATTITYVLHFVLD